MNIALLSLMDPADADGPDKTLNYIFRNMEKDHRVTWIGGRQYAGITGFHRSNHCEGVPFIAETYASLFGKTFSDLLSYTCYDLVVCRENFLLAYLVTDIPVIYITDIGLGLSDRFAQAEDAEFSRMAEKLEERAFGKATHIVYTSESIRTNAVENYGVPSEKTSVVGFRTEKDDVSGLWTNHIKEYADRDTCRKGINEIISQVLDTIEGECVPVYAINMKDRKDRREHILREFEGKPEFELHLIEAQRHNPGTVGLWNNIVSIIKMAREREEEVIVICEDDHYFTEHYSASLLFKQIKEAYVQRADVLSGGIGGVGQALPVGYRLYWVDWFWCTQFIVVYASFFDKILSYDFKHGDTADDVISALTSNKMVIYPFISEQKDFGYSDVTRTNMENQGRIREHFAWTNNKFKYTERICRLRNPE